VPQSLYRRIADNLEEQITSGRLPPGSQLPTEAELRDQYDASRNTIRDAIKRLTSMGLIETRQGKGTYVTLRVDPFVTVLTDDPKLGPSIGETATYLSAVEAEHRHPSLTTPKVEVQPAREAVALRLRVPVGTQVVSRHEVRYIDDFPWSLQTSFYPMDFVAGAPRLLMAEKILPGVVHYLGETLKLTQVGYRDWITARRPDENEQEFFGLAHDATVFEIFRTGFDQSKKPMRVTVTVFPTDRNQFIVNVGDLPDPRYDKDPPDTDDGDPQDTAQTPGRPETK
jgi:GntR family transcriptional regulator